MGKTKMRCITCGKWFQSANAREVTCHDCTQKARKEKQAQKNAQSTENKPAGSGASTATAAAVRPPAPPKPKATASGTVQWLDKVADVKIAQPDPPPTKPKIATPPVHKETDQGAGDQRDGHEPGNQRIASPGRPSAYKGNSVTAPASITGPRPRQPIEGEGGRTGKPWQKYNGHGGPGPQKGGPKGRGKPKNKVPTPPKPKKEKTPPPAPFVPTEEQIKQVQVRYAVLAQPAEFDGIRTQIAKELSIPKKAVKKIIKDFRSQEHIPSWWELQTYKGSSEELEQIKAVYQPYLPVPPVGVHKTIAETLSLKPGIVYQAIKAIRQEMELPQYNDPSLHEAELKALAEQRAKKKSDAASTATAMLDAADTEKPAAPSEPTEEQPAAAESQEQPTQQETSTQPEQAEDTATHQ